MPFKFNPLTGSIDSVNSRSENATFEGNVIISQEGPKIKLIDTTANHNDYSIELDGSLFQIRDTTADAFRLKIDENGKVTIGQEAQFNNNATFTGDVKIESTMPRIWLTDTNSDSDFSLYNGNGTFTIKDETTTALPIRIYSGSGGTGSGNAGAIQIDGNLDATAGIDVTGLATFSSNIEARGSTDVKVYLGSTGDTTANNNVHLRADLGHLKFNSAEDKNIYFEENGNTLLTLEHSAGAATFAGNVKMAATKGIEFSHYGGDDSNSATTIASDGNILDDYEEGTWTPGFANGFSAAEITNGTNGAVAKGWYTKIGDLVTAQFYMRLGTSGTSQTDGNHIKINGFPFNSSNTSHYNGGGTTTYVDIASTIGDVSEVVAVYGPDPGTAVVQLYRGSQAYYASNNAVQTGKYIIGMVTYKT